ncbi:NadS family protein [Cohaesibacter celericrescens]|uniref:Transcriptional regulator n=1 Tax=Cohaesibacter celericrescens TaxID=2067669 RepID=A0A2N5XVE8_9HYPH|nr:NadS family protein [Cohaesibacter celericrescens]PLW78459.1 transcriptional regulator [Cohaesibacter celericrescens]
MSFADELLQSANEALAIAQGDAEPAGVYVPDVVDVVAIRKKQKLTQEAFAHRYGLPIGTIRDWEQKRRLPDRAATILLTVIDKAPTAVTQALANH